MAASGWYRFRNAHISSSRVPTSCAQMPGLSPEARTREAAVAATGLTPHVEGVIKGVIEEVVEGVALRK